VGRRWVGDSGISSDESEGPSSYRCIIKRLNKQPAPKVEDANNARTQNARHARREIISGLLIPRRVRAPEVPEPEDYFDRPSTSR
jgi:hypothetical protein